jgi:hypothetical protein
LGRSYADAHTERDAYHKEHANTDRHPDANAD